MYIISITHQHRQRVSVFESQYAEILISPSNHLSHDIQLIQRRYEIELDVNKRSISPEQLAEFTRETKSINSITLSKNLTVLKELSKEKLAQIKDFIFVMHNSGR